jgi:nucleoside-diphosphate-sugar epimerase
LALTGASGWLGRNFIDELENILPPDSSMSIKLFGSKDSQITNISGDNFRIFDIYGDEIFNYNPTHLIHLAFKTADFIKKLSHKEYELSNINLITRINQIIYKTDLKKILFTSSGVNEKISVDKSNKIYADLKNYEKEIILNACAARHVREIELRIWAVTGNYFDKIEYFAFSQFIYKALKNESIIISSNNTKNRTYMDAGDIAKVGINSMFMHDERFINCAKDKHINLVDLANLVTNTLHSESQVFFNIDKTLDSEDYFPKNTNLNSFLVKSGLELLSLKDQIIKTAAYIKRVNEF